MKIKYRITGLAFIILLSATLFGAFGCSSKSKGMGDGQGTQQISDQDLALDAERYGNGNIPEAQEGGLFADIHFDYDSSVIREDYREMLRQNAQVLSSDSSLHAEIEGHCDKRGTNEYNLALGEERAKAVASLLLSFGARPSQLSTISYGEEIPVDPKDTEEAYAKNRRVHFALYRPKK